MPATPRGSASASTPGASSANRYRRSLLMRVLYCAMRISPGKELGTVRLGPGPVGEQRGLRLIREHRFGEVVRVVRDECDGIVVENGLPGLRRSEAECGCSGPRRVISSRVSWDAQAYRPSARMQGADGPLPTRRAIRPLDADELGEPLVKLSLRR